MPGGASSTYLVEGSAWRCFEYLPCRVEGVPGGASSTDHNAYSTALPYRGEGVPGGAPSTDLAVGRECLVVLLVSTDHGASSTDLVVGRECLQAGGASSVQKGCLSGRSPVGCVASSWGVACLV